MSHQRPYAFDRMRKLTLIHIQELDAMFPQFGFTDLRVDRVILAGADGDSYVCSKRVDGRWEMRKLSQNLAEVEEQRT